MLHSIIYFTDTQLFVLTKNILSVEKDNWTNKDLKINHAQKLILKHSTLKVIGVECYLYTNSNF